MPLPITELDNRTFDQLVTEGRSLIPRYTKEWTNHNPSDPGITLLELFAWLTENAIFQLDQVPELSVEHFLKLVDVCRTGPLANKEAIDQTLKRALETVAQTNRAITRDDFVALAKATAEEGTPVVSVHSGAKSNLTSPLAEGATLTQLVVKDEVFREGERVRVGLGENTFEVTVGFVSGNTLTVDPFQTRTDYPEGRPLARADFVLLSDDSCAPADHPEEAPQVALVIAVPDEPTNPTPTPSSGLKDLLFHGLRQHRLLTTRLQVIGPQYVEVNVDVTVARKPGSGLTAQDVKQVILDFLHPLHGGSDGTGWPFGRAVFYSEMFQQLEGQPSVDHVEDLALSTQLPGTLTGEGVVIPAHELIRVGQVNVTITEVTD